MGGQVGHNSLMARLSARIRDALLCAALVPCLVAANDARAQDALAGSGAADYAPATGDLWLDRHLLDINGYAARYPRAFADEVSRYYSVPRPYVEAMLQQSAWTPGDVFMACALAQRVGQSCRAAVRDWSRDHEDGWAGVAERLGLDPDSRDYRQLRQDVQSSYRRWARPLLDH